MRSLYAVFIWLLFMPVAALAQAPQILSTSPTQNELNVAADENMSDDSSDLLGRVLKSLDELGYDPDPDNDPPTKQGGVGPGRVRAARS